jgi:plastocyanin
VSSAPAPSEDCGADKALDLEITGSGQEFDKDCLVAPVGEDFTVTFINENGTHNFELFPSPDELDEASLITKAPDSTGPATTETDPAVSLDAGDYYFQCLYHPTTMNGFLAVKGAK